VQIDNGCVVYAEGHYVIIYRPQASDVLIVRVLHGAMELRRHIGDEDT